MQPSGLIAASITYNNELTQADFDAMYNKLQYKAPNQTKARPQDVVTVKNISLGNVIDAKTKSPLKICVSCSYVWGSSGGAVFGWSKGDETITWLGLGMY